MSPSGATQKRPLLRSQRRREAVTGYLFASPWIFGFLAITLGPMLFSLYASFTSYHITDTPQWLGAQNYQFILQHDPDFSTSLGNTVWYVIVKTPVVISLSLVIAVLMNQNVPGVKIFRTIYYMPTVITGVAAIFLWVWVLNPSGILNTALAYFHLAQPNWFYDPAWSKPGLIVMGAWYIGSPVLLLLAGLTGIPRHLYEAAEIDGAGMLRKFWNVTIPMLSPTLFFLVLTNIIGAFQVFNSAYVISTSGNGNTQPGDPQRSLLFYEVYLYNHFKVQEMGYTCAIAWILFVIVLAVTLFQLWLSRRWVYYES